MRVLILLFAAVLGGCSGQLPSMRVTEGVLIAGGRDSTETDLTTESVEVLNSWLATNHLNWTREYLSLPPYPYEAVVMLNEGNTVWCAIYIYSESLVIMFLGKDGSLWSKRFPPEEMRKLKKAIGLSN